MNPYQVVRDFEYALGDYTGAPYVVCVDSCSNALFLCCRRLRVDAVTLPRHTYLSVPMSVIHAGGTVVFETLHWQGMYQLKPYAIWDASKRMKKGMYIPGSYMALSFHDKKHVPIGKGGAILCDNGEDNEWFRRARYSGRSERPYHEENDVEFLGWNMYMTPTQAERGLELLRKLPDDNDDLSEDPPYRDLTEFTAFKNCVSV